MSKAMRYIFFFNDTATTEIYTLSLHDALPILLGPEAEQDDPAGAELGLHQGRPTGYPLRMQHPPGQQHLVRIRRIPCDDARSEEHTSELQSLAYLVCRLLLEKKKKTQKWCAQNIKHLNY